MKILSIVLSVYFILLSGIACADELESSLTDNQIVKAISATDSGCCDDVCSPLCVCACSAGFTFSLDSYPGPLSTLNIKLETAYKQRSYSSISYPLFQPPKA